MPFPNLFKPLQIGPVTIKNRLVFAPTCPTMVNNALEGAFTEEAVSYYEERAKGEIGLIIIGGTHVHRDALMYPLLMPQLFNDKNIPRLREIKAVCGKHDVPVFIQLWHSGLFGTPLWKTEPLYDVEAEWSALAPSQVPQMDIPGVTPKALEIHEIEAIVDSFGKAAARAKQAGLDGVEFHLAHGYLPWQFLSPYFNKRTDKYGGSLESRARFPIEAMTRMKENINSNMALGFRISCTANWPGDLTVDDTKEAVKLIERSVDVDFVDVTMGVYHTTIHAPMYVETGFEAPYAQHIKEVSKKPVFMVGRINEPALADRLIGMGVADAICLARQLFSDPYFAKKAKEGKVADIRSCVAVNYCWSRVVKGLRVQCVQNAALGRESIWGEDSYQPAETERKILVMGGGPAGLEAARVLAYRGHKVTLYEKEDHLGGNIRLEARLPGRSELGNIAVWLEHQAEKYGVKTVLKTEVKVDNLSQILAAEKPEVAIVATGSDFVRNGFQGFTSNEIPGWKSGNVYSFDDVLRGEAKIASKVIILDDLADIRAPALGEMLAAKGHGVEIVTRWPMVGMELMHDVYLAWVYPRLYKQHVTMTPNTFIRSIDGSRVVLYNVYSNEERVEEGVGSVV
ncbi:MAG: NAD(P)-binding protein, partial [Candidatus Bathyarchaeia archaeon]